MEKKSLGIFILLIIITAFGLQAQSEKGISTDMVRFQGTLGIGIHSDEIKYNAIGDLGFLLNSHLEINGVFIVELGSSQNDALKYYGGTKRNKFSQKDYLSYFILIGPRYHFLNNSPVDVYAGFQPGVAFINIAPIVTHENSTEFVAIEKEVGFAPVASLNGGVAYYGSIFHLFAEIRYTYGRYLSQNYNIPLSQIMPSFGLGFNFGGK